jgi:hypothetical protein
VNKKLSQLTEKITSLSADDLLYVSVNGESKSIKASTIEAPLKSYADQKKSEVISELEVLDDKIDTEISNRQASDVSNLDLARSYTDLEIQSLNTSFLADRQVLVESIAQTYAVKTEIQATLTQFETQQNEFTLSYLDAEMAARIANDEAFLQTAKDYADAEVLEEQSARSAADASTLQSAKDYTDSVVSDMSVSAGSTPVGVICMFAGTSAPSGYLMCDGSAVSRSEHSSLFNVISTAYGVGNGTTTFNLPNPDGNANIRYIIKV